MNVGGHLVHTVAQIGAVEQDVQRDDAYPPLPEQVGRQTRRRVGDHHDSHERRYRFSVGGTVFSRASASALSINSATAWWASKFQ